MRNRIGFLVLFFLVGCQSQQRLVPPPGCEPVYSQYHSEQFQWSGVSRVLILPFANESSHTRADEEISKALRAELQQLGRFEVVAAPHDDVARLSEQIHRNGRFSEDAMIQLGKMHNADVVVHGAITQYSPYPRPRIGIVIQAVSPYEGKVISSVDGLWDANHLPIAKRAQSYYIQRRDSRTAYHDANWIYPDDGHADELALLSPQLYQRWVSSEVAALLVQDPSVVGQLFAPKGTKAVTPARKPEPRGVSAAGFPMPVESSGPVVPASNDNGTSREPDLAPKP
jgi:Peptidoglycan-synthase activator LpoB